MVMIYLLVALVSFAGGLKIRHWWMYRVRFISPCGTLCARLSETEHALGHTQNYNCLRFTGARWEHVSYKSKGSAQKWVQHTSPSAYDDIVDKLPIPSPPPTYQM